MLLDDLPLPADLLWANEFEWSAVQQAADRALDGTLVVQEAAKHHGREIQLVSRGAGWAPRATVLALKAMESEPGRVLLLTLPGHAPMHVMFHRASGGPAVAAQQVLRTVAPGPDWFYTLDLNFITVSPPEES